MELIKCYLVKLKKGPIWTAEATPELKKLQARHLAHLSTLAQAGKMAASGPIEDHADGSLRGISLYYASEVANLEELKLLVEADPMIQVGRLVAEYHAWFVGTDSPVGQALVQGQRPGDR